MTWKWGNKRNLFFVCKKYLNHIRTLTCTFFEYFFFFLYCSRFHRWKAIFVELKKRRMLILIFIDYSTLLSSQQQQRETIVCTLNCNSQKKERLSEWESMRKRWKERAFHDVWILQCWKCTLFVFLCIMKREKKKFWNE